MEPETRKLPVIMGDSGLAQDAAKLARLYYTIDQRKEELRNLNKEHRASIGKLQDQANELRGEIMTGVREKDVPVRAQIDQKRGVVDVFRLDTGEIIETRQMTAEERQSLIPFEEPDAGAGAEGTT